MPLNPWMEKQWHIHAVESYPAPGGTKLLIHTNMGESHDAMLNERSEREKGVCMPYDAIYIKFWEMQINLHWQKADQ